MKKFIPVILLICLTATAFAQVNEPSTSYVRGLTPGRARALVGVALAIASIVISRRAKNRPADRRSAVVATVLGSIAVIINVLHLFNTSGGFGTGGGMAGAIVGFALAITGLTIGSRALMRSQKNT